MDDFPSGRSPASAPQAGLNRALAGYYMATLGFVVLDFGLGINVRLSFLDQYDGWRILYYLVCLACLFIVLVKPALTVAVTAVESLVTMVALILSTATRVMIPGAEGGVPGVEELINFLVSGFAAHLSWTRSMTTLFGRP